MKTFSHYNLPKTLLHSLDTIGFKMPTPIQEKAIPVVISGQDILGSAQTGTGKTGAYAIPLVAKLLSKPDECVLILTPTRELATQVIKTFHQLLSSEKFIKTALLIGGESITKQFISLKSAPRLIVGTPGRINDHLKRGTLKLYNTHSLVLDETDRMLDMGFGLQIERIIEKLPKDRQTLMFSATMPKNIESLANKYLKNVARIKIGNTTTPVMKIKQDILMTSEKDKYSQLIGQLEQRSGSVIVFVKTKRGADALTVKLNKEDHRSVTIHGDLRQNKRDKAINAFRKERFRIMVATDVAARGLDIPHIRHVINYDLPQCPEDYIHRLGRTARAGESGEAISFITKSDKGKWYAIERMMSPEKKDHPLQKQERRKPRRSRAKMRKKFKQSVH